MRQYIKAFIVASIFLAGCNSKSANISEANIDWRNLETTKVEIFIHEYPEDHLKNNPLQKIQKIILRVDHWSVNNKIPTEQTQNNLLVLDYSHIDIFAKKTDSSNWYQAQADCQKRHTDNVYKCESAEYAEFAIVAINDINEVTLSKVNAQLDQCALAPSALNIKTINLNNTKGKSETFKLYLSDEFSFKNILKGSNCVAPLRDGQENIEYL